MTWINLVGFALTILKKSPCSLSFLSIATENYYTKDNGNKNYHNLIYKYVYVDVYSGEAQINSICPKNRFLIRDIFDLSAPGRRTASVSNFNDLLR